MDIFRQNCQPIQSGKNQKIIFVKKVKIQKTHIMPFIFSCISATKWM